MKNILYSLLIMLVLFSCKSNQDIRQNIKPFIQCVWVKKGYVEDVSKTRSPYLSRANQSGVTSIFIDILNSKADSTYAGYNQDNHEGSGFELYFKAGHKPTSLKTAMRDYDGVQGNFYELGYHVSGPDTNLVLYHYNKNNLVIDSTEYVKVANEPTGKVDPGWGVQYITNKKIMAGKYVLTGTNGPASEIKFDEHGKVSGFLDFKNYEINTDFTSSAENNLDQVGFYATDVEQAKWYSYQFNADTLKLFETKDNADSTLLILDKLKYKLVKQK